MTGMVIDGLDALDHLGIAHAGHAAVAADVGRHPLERHDGDGAGVLGDRACSASTTSMMTPPLSISARPRLTSWVPVSRASEPFGELISHATESTGGTRGLTKRDPADLRGRWTGPSAANGEEPVGGGLIETATLAPTRGSSTQVRPGVSEIG